MRHRGVCTSLTCQQRTTSLPDTRLWQCYMQWTALKAMRVCRLRRPATRWPSPWKPPSQNLHPRMLFPAPHLTALTMSGLGCMPCLISMPMVLPRMTSILGILRQCNTASPPAMMPQSHSPTGAYHQTSSRRWRNTSRDSWPRESLWKATVPTLLRWSWWGRRTAVFGSVSTTGDWTWRLLVMPTHSPGSRSPWMHWWGPSTSRPWTSPVVPQDLHGSLGPAQDSVHDTFWLVWIHKDAKGPGVSPCHLPTSDAGNHVRLCLPVSARLPRRPPCLLQDVRQTHGALGTTPAAGDRDRSQTESQQVPVPEVWSHLSWPHDLGWWSKLRVWHGGVCTELANTTNNNRAAQLSWLCKLLPAVHQRVCQDCCAAPWPGERRSQALQEEGSWCIQALGSQAPRGLRIIEGGYDNSSCTWLCWLHQTLHFGDGCQPWWAQRHPVPGTGWEVRSACLCQPGPPTQWEKQFTLQQHEAGVSCHEMGNNKFRHYLLGGKLRSSLTTIHWPTFALWN